MMHEARITNPTGDGKCRVVCTCGYRSTLGRQAAMTIVLDAHRASHVGVEVTVKIRIAQTAEDRARWSAFYGSADLTPEDLAQAARQGVEMFLEDEGYGTVVDVSVTR